MNKLRRIFIGSMFLIILPCVAFSQFRIVGYVALGKQPAAIVSDTALKNLTHLNIAFVNPDSTGSLIVPNGFDSLIEKAHANNVKVLMAIGGGSFNPYYANLFKKENRTKLIDALVTLCLDRKLDGIDVDIENDNIDKNYEGFITDLHTYLRPQHKLMTAALATWNGQLIPDTTLKLFDFINVMSYDQTGPWAPEKPGPHSTYQKAIEDLNYWTINRKVPKHKLNLGVPFYGYGFGTTFGESMSYSDIIRNFEGAEKKDSILPADGGAIYYNGINTIQDKTRLALKNAGGVMIWQILQDAPADNSLLDAIKKITVKRHIKK